MCRRFVLLSRHWQMQLCVMLIAALAAPCPAAQAAPKYGNSLDWAPADAVFYSASLRNKEQIDIVAGSKAWQRLTQMPAVQMLWQMAQFGLHQPGGPGDQALKFLDEPENEELLALLGDAMSSEVVLYGDPHAANFMDALLRTFNSIRYSQTAADVRRSGDKDEMVARAALNALNENRDRLGAPGLVLGFRVTDTQRAKNQIARLESVLQPLVEQEPRLRGRLKRATAGGAEYLTFELDGGMIPWEEVEWDKVAENPGQYDQLQAKLKGLKAVVSIGLWRDYLLISIGESLAQLESLGTGKLLADVPELQPLAKFADKRLTDIGYVSKSFMTTLASAGGSMEDLVHGVRHGLESANVSDEMKERVVKDMNELADDLKGVMPKPGAQTSFSFLTERGKEGYAYNWAENFYYDASKPLDLLDHVGGTPLVALVSRGKYSPEQYDMLRKWIKKGYGYFNELAVPQFSANERQKYERFKQLAEPLIDQLDKATSQLLIPSLADGQTGFVLDAKITSRQWFEALPQGDRELPMLEPALVLGVSDADKLKQAVSQYRMIADNLIEKIREIEPEAIPADFTIPQPETTNVQAGSASATVYGYKLPDDAGIDEQLMPNAGLTRNVAVLSLAPKQTVRLLADQPLVVTEGGPLSDRSKPLAAAVYCNWAGTVDAATPWIDWVVREVAGAAAHGMGAGGMLVAEAPSDIEAGETDDPSTKFILDQVHTVLDFLKTLRTHESATYAEGGAMVTHWLTVFRDVD